MSRPFIVVGDTTDHGGKVLEGSPADTIDGKPIARVGDKVSCPRPTCWGSQVIIEGDPGVMIDGKAAAFHGAKTSCGAILIASKIDNQIGGSEDSAPSSVASKSEATQLDPRTGLRAGPTRENLTALGMPQGHSAINLSTKDPLPGSIMSGDYAAQNDVTLSKDQRRERVFMLLKSREGQLRSAGQHYGVDPRAIAAAISWEFTENRKGYTSDKMLAPTQQDGYGWGSIHDETLRKEMLPGTSLNESVALRNNLDSSIELVGARIRQQADTYKSISNIDLSNNPVASTWLFNTSSIHVERSAQAQAQSSATPTLNVQNDMAQWTSQNLFQFDWLKPTTSVANSGIPYNYTVTGE